MTQITALRLSIYLWMAVWRRTFRYGNGKYSNNNRNIQNDSKCVHIPRKLESTIKRWHPNGFSLSTSFFLTHFKFYTFWFNSLRQDSMPSCWLKYALMVHSKFLIQISNFSSIFDKWTDFLSKFSLWMSEFPRTPDCNWSNISQSHTLRLETWTIWENKNACVIF